MAPPSPTECSSPACASAINPPSVRQPPCWRAPPITCHPLAAFAARNRLVFQASFAYCKYNICSIRWEHPAIRRSLPRRAPYQSHHPQGPGATVTLVTMVTFPVDQVAKVTMVTFPVDQVAKVTMVTFLAGPMAQVTAPLHQAPVATRTPTRPNAFPRSSNKVDARDTSGRSIGRPHAQRATDTTNRNNTTDRRNRSNTTDRRSATATTGSSQPANRGYTKCPHTTVNCQDTNRCGPAPRPDAISGHARPARGHLWRALF